VLTAFRETPLAREPLDDRLQTLRVHRPMRQALCRENWIWALALSEINISACQFGAIWKFVKSKNGL